MGTHEKFLTEIERFIKAESMTATQFGIAAMSDPNFVHRLRAGQDVRSRTIDKVRGFILEYRKENPRRRAEARAA